MSGTLRRRDLTPTTFERYYQLQNHPRDVGLGQANEFLQFINSSIKPLVHKRYRSKESDNTLVGYSLSGLFSLYVLFHHTESFDRYVVGSPSLWWDSGITFQYEEEYARTNLSLPVHLYLSVGTLESTESKMQANVRQLITQLQSRSYTHLTLDTDIFENETHGSGLAHGLLTGLRRVFENYQGH